MLPPREGFPQAVMTRVAIVEKPDAKQARSLELQRGRAGGAAEMFQRKEEGGPKPLRQTTS